MSRLLTAAVLGVGTVGALLAQTPAPVQAQVATQNWVETLFAEKSFDFGPVPRGGVVRHPFTLSNRLNVPIQVVGLRVSCGCTSGTSSATLIQPGQAATIEAQMDTRNFVGRKSTTLFVSVIAGNQSTEIGLGVSSLILSDVVLNPGTVDFGAVTRGQTPQQVLTIDRVGKPDWRITKLVSAGRSLAATLAETRRSNGEVGYQLTVSLRPEAPAGFLRDEIRLMTNDPETPSIPIPVSGQVRGDLSVTPGAVNLGATAATSGGTLTGKFVVRASRPFTIRQIDGQGDGFTLQAADKTAKPLQVVTLTYNPKAGQSRGDLRKAFRIVTDMAGEPPLDVTASVHVEP